MSSPMMPGSNVTPLWGAGAPGPFPPGAVPPGCFSELARLNACYNEIQMMEMILAKVITDLVTNDKQVQAAIVAAIAASGSNVPLIGVTNGSNAQPGQVGEFLVNTQTINVPNSGGAQSSQIVQSLVLPPGDWDMWASFNPAAVIEGVAFFLSPEPAGFSNGLAAWLSTGTTTPAGLVAVSETTRASVSVPTLIIHEVNTISATATTATFQVEARRAR